MLAFSVLQKEATAERFVLLTPGEALTLAESLSSGILAHHPLQGKLLPTVDKASLPDPYKRILSDVLHVASLGPSLVFFNRRASLEWFADRLSALAKERGLPEDTSYHHHSSLSKEVREGAEH
jgi:Lhr-like helicase